MKYVLWYNDFKQGLKSAKFALRASEVIFDSEVHFVSEVPPCGEVKGDIPLRVRYTLAGAICPYGRDIPPTGERKGRVSV